MSLADSLAPLDLSLNRLKTRHPQHYRRWVGTGVIATLLGYGASSAALFLEYGSGGWQHSDPYTMLVQLVALTLWLRGRAQMSAGLTLLSVWVDLQVTVIFHGLTPLPTTLALSPLVMGAGLLLGARAALACAGVSAVSLPLFTWLGHHLGMHPGLSTEGALPTLVAAEAVLCTTAALVSAYLHTFAHSLRENQIQKKESRRLRTQLEQAQKMEALGLLAGGIAHDFNNLLTAVGGYGSLLATSSDPDAREFATEVMAVQERGASLVRQMLAFARQEVPEPRAFDVAATLVDMAGLLQRLLGEQIKLELELGLECPIVADPGQIEQVILNLAANARDAMPGGGYLRIETHRTGEKVVLKVQDNGDGMDELTQKRVFEPFFTTKERGKGTGLGLSTVHGIVTASGGEISVESDRGEGTCFTLTWPLGQLSEQQEKVRPPALMISGEDRVVVMVEDNDGVRVLVNRVLTQAGFAVKSARNADEAMSILENLDTTPSLLLTDVIMPGISGPQLVDKVRQRWPRLPFLFMSGYMGDLAEDFGFDPVHDVIGKPFRPNELLERIEERIFEARARRTG